MKIRTLKKMVAVMMVAVAVVGTAGRGTAQAMLVPSTAAQEGVQAQRQADLETVRGALENQLVRQRLMDMGLKPDQVEQRLGKMDSERLHQVAMGIEKQNPAGDAGIGIIAAVVVLLVVLLIVAFAGDHDDDDDHHDDDHKDADTNVQQTTPAQPAGQTPQTIIVK